jgi:hypothetical protein
LLFSLVQFYLLVECRPIYWEFKGGEKGPGADGSASTTHWRTMEVWM